MAMNLFEANTGWCKEERRPRSELGRLAWHEGYFRVDSRDENHWRRNLVELKLRDIALFPLGELSGKRILDVGCGNGLYVLTFLKMDAQFVGGQDLSETHIQRLHEDCQASGFSDKNYEIKRGDCAKLQFPDSSFDLVFSGDFFEHISEKTKEDVLREIYRVLKPGGKVVLKTPNLDYLRLIVFFRRCLAVLMFRAPWKIHVAHTRDNPDCEHFGLTNHRRLEALLWKNTFHEAKVVLTAVTRKGFPRWLGRLLGRFGVFNETVILVAQKPIFLGFYP